MAVPAGYRRYASSAADFAAQIPASTSTPQAVKSNPGAVFWCFDAIDGTRITDLYNASGDPITEITADNTGFVPFYAADNLGSLWLQTIVNGAPTGVWAVVFPTDLATIADQAKATADQAKATADAALPAAQVGVAGGVAELDADGLVPLNRMPDLSVTYAPLTVAGKGVVRQGELVINAKADGTVKGDGVTDDRAAIQTVLDAASAAGATCVYFPPGTYLIDSSTVTGATGYALTVPCGVSIVGAGSAYTTFKAGPNIGTSNLFMVASVLSTTVATLTANNAIGDTAFTVDSSAGFNVGDTVAMRIGQNASDTNEAKQAVFAKVTAVPDGTHLTVDTPAEWTSNTTTQNAVNHQITKVTTVAEKMRLAGFNITGNSGLRHGIGVQWARQLQFADLTGTDVGSGIANAQWCDNVSLRDIYVYSCSAYSNSSKGRGLSLSNVRNVVVNNFTVDRFDGAALYVESYSIGVSINGFRINNRSTARNQAYLIFVGYECDTFIDGLTVTSYKPGASAADSVVSYGSGTGQAQLRNTTIYMRMQDIRSFPIATASGFFRCLDNSGNLRTFNLSKVEKSSVTINLADGTTKTAWLRDGLHLGYEVYVSPGVTSAMLTALTMGRTFVAAVALTWAAGQMTRTDTFCGGGTFPVPSAFSQGSKVTATVAASSGIPANSYAVVTLYSINYNGYATVANEPGSEQAGRFTPSFTV